MFHPTETDTQLVARVFPHHTTACITASMKCALENIRDREGITFEEFRAIASSSQLWDEALSYLATDTFSCECAIDIAFRVLSRMREQHEWSLDPHYVSEFTPLDIGQSAIQAHLENGMITMAEFRTLQTMILELKL